MCAQYSVFTGTKTIISPHNMYTCTCTAVGFTIGVIPVFLLNSIPSIKASITGHTKLIFCFTDRASTMCILCLPVVAHIHHPKPEIKIASRKAVVLLSILVAYSIQFSIMHDRVERKEIESEQNRNHSWLLFSLLRKVNRTDSTHLMIEQHRYIMQSVPLAFICFIFHGDAPLYSTCRSSLIRTPVANSD